MSENNPFYCSFVGNQYIICDCGQAFPSEEALKDHLETEPHDVNLVADYDLNQELIEITEYKCGECGNIYGTEEECMEHQEREHVGVETIQQDEQHQYFEDDQPYEEHIIKTEEIEEKYDPSQMVSFEDPPDTFQAPPPVYSMATLKVTAGDGLSEITERKTKLLKTPEGLPLLNLQEMKILKGKEHRVKVESNEEPKDKKKKVYNKNIVCEVCGKKYASQAALRYHQRVHTGVRPYQCNFCPKTFTMGLFLQIHLRSHTGERPYECKQCPKAFTNKAALLRHDRVHTGEKPYPCPQCGKCFTQSNSMKLHVHTVHLKMPAPYKSKRRRMERARREGLRARGEGAGDMVEITRIAKETPKLAREKRGKITLDKVDMEILGGSRKVSGQIITVQPLENGVQQMVVIKQEDSLDSSPDAPPSPEATRIFYCGALPKEEEVTYEVIYE